MEKPPDTAQRADDVPTSRHDPRVEQRCAERARTIVESARRFELGGAAEFLYTILQVPDGPADDGSRPVPRR